MSTTELRTLLSQKEAAAVFGVTPRTFRKLDVPFELNGRRRVYSIQALNQWIDDHKQRDCRGPKAPIATGDGQGWVYFIGSGDHVKIGYSLSPHHRILQLQAGSPTPLVFLYAVTGTEELEEQIHKKFAHLRVRGEWFHYTDEIRRIVSRGYFG